MFGTCEPLHARTWFNWREPVNWAVSIVVMAVVFLFLMLLAPVWLAFASALLASFLLFFFVLDKKAIVIVCPHCGGHIETDTPWRCGYCNAENFDTENHPFLGRCSNGECRAKPKGYECHHCREPIFFTKDRQKAGIARCAVIPTKTAPKRVKRDKHAEALAQKRKSIELRQLDVQDKQLAVDLKGLDKALEREKNVEELYRAELKDEDDELRLRARIDKEFVNDEETRKRRHLIVDKIMLEKS